MSGGLHIDSVPVGAGSLGMSHCPGRRMTGALLPGLATRGLQADLAAVQGSGAVAVLSLVQAHEFTALGLHDFGPAVQQLGMAWWHVPIADMHTPDAATRAAWDTHRPALAAALRGGGRVHVHCFAGLGRTGMLVARLLVEEGGLSPDEAIRQVRLARPGTIETEAQAAFVRQGWPQA